MKQRTPLNHINNENKVVLSVLKNLQVEIEVEFCLRSLEKPKSCTVE